MQPLVRTLQDHDLGHLRVVAELWGLDPPGGPPPQAARSLALRMLEPTALSETLAALPAEAQAVVHRLAAEHGRLPLADLTRRFGPLREFGAGRRDREKPWRSPVSPLEILWYRGLLARAFADTPSGPCEFAFIPSDVLALLPPTPTPSIDLMGAAAPIPEVWRAATTTAVDDATTLLAALRRRPARGAVPPADWFAAVEVHLHRPAWAPLVLSLLQELGILQPGPMRPNAAATRAWLALPPAAAQHGLLRQWASAAGCNDLAMVPGLACGGDRWPNDPQASRKVVLTWLAALPRQTWWDVEAFVAAVRERQPGFQRPGGDFDSWYLHQPGRSEFLRGFEHWESVEGAYLRHLITGPLWALGAVDVAFDPSGRRPIAFRLTDQFGGLWADSPAETPSSTTPACALEPDGRMTVPRLADRAQRYLIARFCRWQSLAPEAYTYRLTPRSLESAARQGLRPNHVLSVLEAATAAPVPTALRRAIERAFRRGAEAGLHTDLVLRVEEPRILDELRRNRSTARYLGEPVGARAVAVRRRDWPALCNAAARLGLLIEPPHETASEVPAGLPKPG